MEPQKNKIKLISSTTISAPGKGDIWLNIVTSKEKGNGINNTRRNN